MKTILIAVPTNKYIEPETMKSIYDQIIPSGYRAEFQFFYGYQIDQIRNLIAEWSKHYDYLFSVDSDIILPNDTLVNLLNADKDIISGLYIQRKPGQHILEIYQDNGRGGVENIPFRAIEKLDVIPIAACGMGCCLIKGEVFRKMEYPHFYYQSAIDHSQTISEDVYFCNKARSLGFEVWADVRIKCSHKGETTFEVISPVERRLEELSRTGSLPIDHKEYLKNLNPNVAYDIGASTLQWAQAAKDVWPNTELVLFDATSELDYLYRTRGYKHHIGVLTDEDGKQITFYNDPYNPAGNSYYKENSWHYNESHARRVQGNTLDTIVAKNGFPQPDLIKLDVQGAEMDILKGAQNTLKGCKDIILEAQHQNYNEGAPMVDEVIQFVESLGFKLVKQIHLGDVDADYHFTRL
jgi:FkbM family methyltransferase